VPSPLLERERPRPAAAHVSDIGRRPARWRAAPRPQLERWLPVGLAVLSAAAGGIHFAVTKVHFEEYRLFGLFFLALGIWQVLWALLETTGPSRILHLRGAETNVLVVLIWAVSRTVGLPIGPHPGRPEPIGSADVISTLLEVALVIGCMVLARARPPLDGPLVQARPSVPVPAEPEHAPPELMGPVPEWVTVVEAAFLTRSSEHAIRRRMEAGEIRIGPVLKSRKSTIVLIRTDDLWAAPQRPVASPVAAPHRVAGESWVLGPTRASSIWVDRLRSPGTALVALATVAGVLLTAMSGGHGHASVLDHLVGVHAKDLHSGMADEVDHADDEMGGSKGETGESSSQSGQNDEATPPTIITVFQAIRNEPAIHAEGNPCLVLVEQGWTGSCQQLTMAGGRTAWVVQRNPQTTDVVAHVYTYDTKQDAWALRLEARAYEGVGLRSVVMVPADLTGDGTSELVAGFRFVSSAETLSYEVVSYRRGSVPKVAYHSWLDQGSVVIRGSTIHVYSPPPGSDGSGTTYLHQKVEWDGSAFQPEAVGEIARDQVPASQF
jgi:hypothetical protein